ncbi:site-specific integrase [Clostridium paraputrificum]|uniref:tyrosine-type recombinase/integrase n=1 Tax=Clostridium paraputrificum TaxID=29363 RepID=UPI00232FD8CD|nr:site-specific integrase [Clostridium paraputrificum]MDB2091114.1 site-specific integrase [Clostridium paraputrificum]MDB2097868.1 site-specific integrase [Clostridium paraputrificum]
MEETIKYFTQPELKKLFKVIEQSKGKYSLRDLLIFRLAYRCGLRATEIGLITRGDYNKNTKELYCKRLKGSLNNTIRLDKETNKLINKFIKNFGPFEDMDILFKSQKGGPISRKTLDLSIKKYCLAAQLQDPTKWHFHTLKHSCAVHLAESGLDIKELQNWLGHKSVNNTMVYFSFTTMQQQAMYNKLNKNCKMV